MKFAFVFRWCVRGACLFLLAGGTPCPVAAQDAIESGSFRLHKFEQAIGEEKYTIQRSANEIAVTSAFEFTDRGTKVALTSKLNTSPTLMPLSFSAIGDTARGFSIDASAETAGDTVRFRL